MHDVSARRITRTAGRSSIGMRDWPPLESTLHSHFYVEFEMRAAEEELLTRRQEMKNRCGDHSPVAQPDTESLRRGCSTPGGSRVRNLWRSHTAAWNHTSCHSDGVGATGEPGTTRVGTTPSWRRKRSRQTVRGRDRLLLPPS